MNYLLVLDKGEEIIGIQSRELITNYRVLTIPKSVQEISQIHVTENNGSIRQLALMPFIRRNSRGVVSN